MDSAADRLAFAPPQPRGLWRGFALAVLAHLLLVLALMHGLQWKRETQMAAVEAELWSATPQQAAPKEVLPPPPPPVVAPPPPQPVVKAPPPPDPQVQRDAQIAIERDKQKRELARQRQHEQELERQRERAEEKQRERAEEKRRQLEDERQRELQLKRKAEAQKKTEAAQKKRDEELARRREEEQARKQQEAKLAAAEAKRRDDDKRKRQEQDAKKMAQMREDNLRRIQGLAGGSGAPSSSGSAAQSSGPSASWGGRVQARVRPNIVFSDDIAGNPRAEVEVRMAPDGTIVGRRIAKSSGNKAWDEAVLRALDKTEVLPRDVDGRVPSPVIIGFRPKDG